MYPARELTRLARHKQALQRRIARRRRDCVAAAAIIIRPLAWLDRALGVWRKLSPWVFLAGLPLTFLRRGPSPARPRGALWRWLPLIPGILRGFLALRGVAPRSR